MTAPPPPANGELHDDGPETATGARRAMKEIPTEPAASLFDSDTALAEWSRGIDFEYSTCSNAFTFKRATPSGLLVLDPRPRADVLGTIYPDDYEPYQFDRFPALIRKARALVQRLKVRAIARLAPRDASILDVGCGSGGLLRLLREAGSPDWQLHGNDIHMPSLDTLAAEGIIAHCGRVEDIALDACFDIVILNQVIEHFADVRGLVRACRRLLKPGGRIFIETPSIEGLDARVFARRYWGGYHFPRHFFLFDESCLARLLVEEGFRVDSVGYLASPAFWTQSLHHLVLEAGHGRLAKLCHVKNLPLAAFFTMLDILVSSLGGRTSNMRLIASRPS